ncbi:hypothetical protein LOOC260_100840 [Paucilactobacillus hokkaidonensis JCM 18461]|uniref:Uncharacterized protein n=2 Tax=Paucilactobacillus hokkaidonensis TaxID=1193095 RepID=A0A0A1GV26_9LACO|nr:AbrB/MazE/SpoVT family DNA-binding domain-containing protein [Paucilactobacillus hokkaidonensis]KRO09487.1 ABC transporter, permease [Paucilactobacillus hokkaidonensis]BAP84663.1 hypothetical protein LOOC260_100840 [Paucilactobacillus hokkaidonensis JCM 18461]
MSEELKLDLPKQVTEKLQLDAGDRVLLTLKDDSVNIQPTIKLKSKISLWWTLLPTIVASICFNLFFWWQKDNQIKLSGTTSIATAVIFLGLITGTILFIIFFIKNRNTVNSTLRNVYWRNFPTIVLSFTLILFFALLGIFWIFGLIFTGASFDRFTATLIFLVFNSVINYMMILAAQTISSVMLTTLFTIVISSGVIISMASNSQQRWWQHNLSFLGTNLASNSWQFNFTLVFSALIMVVLIDYLFVALQANYPRSRQLTTLRVILTLTAIDLGAVGAFPNNASFHVLHDQLSKVLIYAIILLIVGIKWLLPDVTKEFLTTSYLIGATLILIDVLFQFVGYLSLTAFELIGFILAFGWILLLFQVIAQLTYEQTRIFQIKISR